MDVDDALQWAALYAALSVRVPTGAGGATRLGEFIEEGTRRGLPTPPARGKRVA
jgi:ribokinase